jgi:hypothetical protein
LIEKEIEQRRCRYDMREKRRRLGQVWKRVSR